MSINKEPYYQLVKIGELSKISSGTLVQMVGNIDKVIEDTKTLIIIDETGTHSLKVSNRNDLTNHKENSVVRVFGRWNGLEISIEKLLEWDIPKDKMKYIHYHS